MDELRSQVAETLSRATAAASVSQTAEQTAERAAGRIDDIGEYLAAVTEGVGAPAGEGASRSVARGDAGDPSTLTRDELVARVRELETVLARRSVRAALGITQKLRGS